MNIKGTGSYLPNMIVSNETITDTPDWVYKKLGIKERRTTPLSTSMIATLAATRAIDNAGIEAKDIDMIILATSTPDKLSPSTACMVQNNIGAFNASAFDINAVCSGFVYGLSVASEMPFKNILVIGADTFSSITDWGSRDCVFFGDGAGAVVVCGSAPYRIKADGSGIDNFTCGHKGKFKMNGKEVYKAGLRYLPEIINGVLSDAELDITDIDYLLPHQASKRMLEELADTIGIPVRKVLTNMERYGNTAAASIPILLDENSFKTGDKLLLAAIGSGWTYGAMIIEW